MKPTVFYLDVYNELTESSIAVGFNIDYDLGGNQFLNSGTLADILDNIECDYGPHWWTTDSTGEVWAIGFTTNTVAEDQIDDLVAEWRGAFIAITGRAAVTKAMNVGDITAKTDAEIYHTIQSQLPGLS